MPPRSTTSPRRGRGVVATPNVPTREVVALTIDATMAEGFAVLSTSDVHQTITDNRRRARGARHSWRLNSVAHAPLTRQ